MYFAVLIQSVAGNNLDKNLTFSLLLLKSCTYRCFFHNPVHILPTSSTVNPLSVVLFFIETFDDFFTGKDDIEVEFDIEFQIIATNKQVFVIDGKLTV